jgi:hypothetical protein
VNGVVLSGAFRVVPSGAHASCYPVRQSHSSHCFEIRIPRRNSSNEKSKRFLLTRPLCADSVDNQTVEREESEP